MGGDSRWIRRVTFLLKTLAALGIVAYLLHLVSWEEIVRSAAQPRPTLVLAALLMLPVNLALELWLWHRLASLGAERPALMDSISALLAGHAAGIVTPARAGEVLVRAVYAGHRDRWHAGALALVHRMLDFHAAVLIGVPTCVYFIVTRSPVPSWLWYVVAGTGLFSLVLLSLVLARPQRLFSLSTRLLRNAKWTDRLLFLTGWPVAERGFLLLLAVIRFCVYVMQFVILLHAFGSDVGWLPGFVLGGIIFFGKLLVPPITLTDVGIREGVSVYVGAFFGVAGAVAFNAAFTLFLINLVVPALLGVPFLLRSSGARARSPVASEAWEPGS